AMSFVMAYGESYRPLPLSIDSIIALEETERYWQRWSSLCKAQGRWRKTIMRSLLTLKGLSYAPTRGIVAAATISLPEKIGGPGTGGRIAAAVARKRIAQGVHATPGKNLALAGRGDMGNPGDAAAFRPFQGDGLGGVRSCFASPRFHAAPKGALEKNGPEDP